MCPHKGEELLNNNRHLGFTCIAQSNPTYRYRRSAHASFGTTSIIATSGWHSAQIDEAILVLGPQLISPYVAALSYVDMPACLELAQISLCSTALYHGETPSAATSLNLKERWHCAGEPVHLYLKWLHFKLLYFDGEKKIKTFELCASSYKKSKHYNQWVETRFEYGH